MSVMHESKSASVRHRGQFWRRSIFPHQRKSAQQIVAKRMLEVCETTRAQVVAFNSLVATGQETIHQSGPDEAGGAGYKGSHHASPMWSWLQRAAPVNAMAGAWVLQAMVPHITRLPVPSRRTLTTLLEGG
jgi:hypothetical protein